MTPAEIIYHRCVQVLDRAGQTSVTEACRTFGISRTTSYRWAGRAQRYGLAALVPKGRRPPVMPTATPPDQVEVVLAEAVARPTIGAQRLVGLCQVGARGRPLRRSQPGAGRLHTGQAPAQQANKTCSSPSSCHKLRPTPPVLGVAAVPG